MSPKPFKPPRPSSTSASSSANPSSKSSKSVGRPRKSDTSITSTSKPKPKAKSKPDTGFQKASTNAGIQKRTSGKGLGKERRLSAREMGLPSLSPDSELEGEDGEEEDVDMGEGSGEEGEDPFSSQPASKPSTSASKRRPNRAPTLSRSPSPSQQLQHENSNLQGASDEQRQESIPPNLLTHLLQSMFTQQGTRISKSANAAVGRYMETFVREGVARCVWARAEGVEGGGGGDGGFLEVEDLERLGPQLLLDF
ncbi:CENP-S associating centromere protein X-domain-containing protein [Halenospora varia]|nr:CENP-S associating centromere protein X-domain-containing protein [Halenospora varia]